MYRNFVYSLMFCTYQYGIKCSQFNKLNKYNGYLRSFKGAKPIGKLNITFETTYAGLRYMWNTCISISISGYILNLVTE